MIFHIRWRLLGGHYHCRLFGSKSLRHTFALYGNMIIPAAEWEGFKKAFPNVEFGEDYPNC